MFKKRIKTQVLQSAENLYQASVPLSAEDFPELVQRIAALCEHKSILYPPELRSFVFLRGDAGALESKNAIIYNEEWLAKTPLDELAGPSAHEIGHIVFEDSGIIGRKEEERADRFEHFLTGDPSAYIRHITHVAEQNDRETQRNIKTWTQRREQHRLHGSLEHRIENLRRPVSEEEKKPLHDSHSAS